MPYERCGHEDLFHRTFKRSLKVRRNALNLQRILDGLVAEEEEAAERKRNLSVPKTTRSKVSQLVSPRNS